LLDGRQENIVVVDRVGPEDAGSAAKNQTPRLVTPFRKARNAEMQVFAMRLRKLMVKKGWNQSELSRRSGIGRDMISGYIRALHMPEPPHARRLAAALDVEFEGLFMSVEDAAVPMMAAKELPPLEMRSTSAGRVMLHVNLELPMAVALQVLALVQGAGAEAP